MLKIHIFLDLIGIFQLMGQKTGFQTFLWRKPSTGRTIYPSIHAFLAYTYYTDELRLGKRHQTLNTSKESLVCGRKLQNCGGPLKRWAQRHHRSTSERWRKDFSTNDVPSQVSPSQKLSMSSSPDMDSLLEKISEDLGSVPSDVPC